MKKIFDFGKIDYYGIGRKSNAVTVEIEYTEKNEQKAFTASGNIWNAKHTNILTGGQCLDEIAKYITDPTFCEILRLWRLYHLNDMRPECEHQRAAGWDEQAKKKVILYTFKMTSAAISAQREVKDKVLNAARNGSTYIPTEAERQILALKYSITIPENCPPADMTQFYMPDKTEEKICGWIEETEHPEGILCKPCPVCGYRYGTEWKYLSIPAEDEQIIYKLLKGE